MVEHLQSGDQAMAPEDSAWQAMPHFSEIGRITASKCSVAASRYDAIFIFFCLVSDNWHLASLLGQNFTPVIMIQIQKNKGTTWYFILFYFSASQSLIGSQQLNQRHDVTTDFLVVKYQGYIAGKKISLPSSTRPTIKPSQLKIFHFT